jgi:hypothetical protein
MGASRSLGFLLACLLAASWAPSSEGRAPGQPPLPSGGPPPADLGDEGKPGKGDLNEVSLEVAALQALAQLQLTPAQLKDLARRARDTTQKEQPRQVVSASDKFRQTLTGLRNALVANDPQRIDELGSALNELYDKEKPELDDSVEITDEARRQAPEVLRRLSAPQVAGYLGAYADQVPDPGEMLADALREARKLSGMEWQQLRDDAAEQVGWLLAGPDAEAEEQVRDDVTALLNRAHRLSARDFAAQKGKLEEKARALAGKLGPTDVLRHYMERSLAELLSNPRLPAAVVAHLKKKK